MGIENAAQRRSAWMTDLLPECPLYKIFQQSWTDTKMHLSADCFRQAAGDPDTEIVPKFKSNLHWSITSPSNDALATPIEFPSRSTLGTNKII